MDLEILVFPLAVLTLISGNILSFAGRPYRTVMVTLHKLSAVGAAALLTVIVLRVNRSQPLSTDDWAWGVFSAVAALVATVSGGIVTASSSPKTTLVWQHRIASWLTFALAGIAAIFVFWI